MSKRPVLIELDEPAEVTPATAPVIADEVPQGRAIQTVAALAAEALVIN